MHPKATPPQPTTRLAGHWVAAAQRQARSNFATRGPAGTDPTAKPVSAREVETPRIPRASPAPRELGMERGYFTASPPQQRPGPRPRPPQAGLSLPSAAPRQAAGAWRTHRTAARRATVGRNIGDRSCQCPPARGRPRRSAKRQIVSNLARMALPRLTRPIPRRAKSSESISRGLIGLSSVMLPPCICSQSSVAWAALASDRHDRTAPISAAFQP